MKLLTKEIEERFTKTGSQEEVADPMVLAKFFNPTGAGTWLALEYDAENKLFFGYVSLFNTEHENELGYFALEELESFRGQFGLGIERDIHFTPAPLSEVKRKQGIK